MTVAILEMASRTQKFARAGPFQTRLGRL